jgi:hypothetical protein
LLAIGWDRVAIAILAALVLFLFRDAVFGGRVFYYRDIHAAWHPQVAAFIRAVREGSWPLWDRFPGFGQPLLADPGAQVLYPPTWLTLVVQPWDYYTLYVVGHVAMSAFASYFLGRRSGLTSAGAFVAAACWTLCGPYLSATDLWHHFAGASWIPVVLLAATRAFDEPGARGSILLGLALAGQILAGSADLCAITLVALAAWTASWMQGPPWRASSRAVVLRASAGLILALGLTAVLWIPVVELALASERRALAFGIRTYWSVHPLVLLDALVADLWGALPLNDAFRARLFDSREPFLSSLYLGAGTLPLVAMGLSAPAWRHRRVFTLLGSAALVAALGRHTPAYQVATTLFPPLKIFRYPVKAMILVAFCWAFVAGAGFDRCRQDLPRRAASRTAATLGAVALLELIGLSITWLRPQSWAPVLATSTAVPQAAAAVAGIAIKLAVGAAVSASASLLLLGWRRGWISAPALVLGALALGELIYYNRNASPLAPKALYTHRPEVLATLDGVAVPRVYVYDYTRLDRSRRYLGRSRPYVLGALPRGWEGDAAAALAQQMYLAPVTGGRWPGVLGSYDLDVRGLYPPPLAQLTLLLRQVEGTPAHLRLLQLGGVTHVIALHEAGFEDLQPRARVPGLLPEPIRVFRVPATLPLAYAVAGARVAQGGVALQTLLDPAFDPTREVVLPEGEPTTGARPSGSAWLIDARADRIRLLADLPSPGYVVLLEGFAPGWRARVDDRPAKVLRANLVFRAIAAGAGRHVIECVYRPASLALGLLVSATTLALVAAYAARRRASHDGAHGE